MQEQFEKDKTIGETSESLVMEMIKHKFHHMIKIPGKFSPYDLLGVKGDGSVVTFEVKMDSEYKNTGNVPIEIGHRGELTGINTSKADYWIIHLEDDGYYMSPRESLYNFIYWDGDCVMSIYDGQGDKSKLALIPIGAFKQQFTKIA